VALIMLGENLNVKGTHSLFLGFSKSSIQSRNNRSMFTPGNNDTWRNSNMKTATKSFRHVEKFEFLRSNNFGE